MRSHKIIWSWVFSIAAIWILAWVEAYESKMLAILFFGAGISALRKDIDSERIGSRPFSFFWELSAQIRIAIVCYFMLVSCFLLWLSVSRPEALATVIYGEYGTAMLFLVLSPLLAPALLSLIKYDIRLLRNERRQT